MLTIDDLHAGYGQATALRGVSLRVGTGQAVGIIGSNGAGKSTLLNCISGLVRPRQGSVDFDGSDITGTSGATIARSGLVQVPEGRRIFASLTVRENLEVAAGTRKRRERLAAVDEQMDLFQMLRDKSAAPARSLSGGQQQMLAIARALMAAPRLLMLDEPSLGLAPIVVDQVFTALKELLGRGLTVLMVEQNAARALDYVSYCYVMERGHIVTRGTSEDIRADESVIEHYLAVPRKNTTVSSGPLSQEARK